MFSLKSKYIKSFFFLGKYSKLNGHRDQSGGLDLAFPLNLVSCFPFFFFCFHTFKGETKFTVHETKIMFMHCSYIVYILFTGLTILFIHLKIILLQCFQF